MPTCLSRYVTLKRLLDMLVFDLVTCYDITNVQCLSVCRCVCAGSKVLKSRSMRVPKGPQGLSYGGTHTSSSAILWSTLRGSQYQYHLVLTGIGTDGIDIDCYSGIQVFMVLVHGVEGG